MLVTTGSLDGCSVLSETQSVGTRLRVNTTQVSSVGVPPPMGIAIERPEIDIKPPLWAPHLIFTPGYLLKSFPQGILLHDSGGLESVLSLS